MLHASGMLWKIEKFHQVLLVGLAEEVDDLLGRVRHRLDDLLDLVADPSEQALGAGAVLQAQVAAREQLQALVAVVDRVVEVLLDVLDVEALERAAQLVDQAVLLLAGLGHRHQLALDLAEVGDRHHVVGHHHAARLGEQRRLARAHLAAGLDHLEHHLRRVLLERVVGRRRVRRARAVVVDADAAAEVEVAQLRRQLLQLGVDAGALADGRLDALDLGDLRADVEVQQRQLLDHPGGRQLAHHRQQLVGRRGRTCCSRRQSSASGRCRGCTAWRACRPRASRSSPAPDGRRGSAGPRGSTRAR